MSCTLVLMPMAIAIAGSVGAGTLLVSKSEHLEEKELDLKKEKIMQETKKSLGLEQEEPLLIQTIMRNASILQETAVNLGYEPVILNEHQMEIQLEEGNMIFHSGEDDIFLATFRGNISKENAESYMTEFHDAYTTLVQQRTYQKLLEKIKERNLNLESEKVTEDNSIVLTLVVQE